MQTVSASKMRRAQRLAVASRPYSDRSWEVLGHVVARLGPAQRRAQPLLQQRPVRALEVVVVTANRGLCGGHNHNIIEAAMEFILAQTVPVRVVAVGSKGRDYAARHGLDVVAEFCELGDRPELDDIRPLVRVLVDDLQQGAADQVWLVYTEFISTLRQQPRVRQLLPVQPAADAPADRAPYLFEPAPEAILGPMLRRCIETQVFRAILEAQACEHSARMLAMGSASDNAERLISELTLSYNKARQEAITKELIDIVGGVAAVTR